MQYKAQYRKPDEMNYYGSDLNKYTGTSLPRVMTVNNFDLVILKRTKKIIRIIESKHIDEKLPWEQEWENQTQHELLALFAKFGHVDGYQLEVYVVQGDPPFDAVIVYQYKTDEIQDIHTYRPECFTLNNSQLKKFLKV